MLKFIDRLSDLCARLAEILFFAIGIMITFEVVARYVFNAPTIWAEELSRFFQIWATYLACAYVFRQGHLISITVIIDRCRRPIRLAARVFSLSVIILFSAAAIWYGSDIVLESIEMGRSTSTMLSVPKWMTESAIPFGFLLLFVQAVRELVRVFSDPDALTGPAGGHP